MTRPVYTKALVAAVGALSTWGVVALEDESVRSVEWFGLLGALATAVGVYAVTNGEDVDPTTSTPEVSPDAGMSLPDALVVIAILLVLLVIAGLI